LTVMAPVVTRTPFRDQLSAILFEPTNPSITVAVSL
jgi:hypothetical protein